MTEREFGRLEIVGDGRLMATANGVATVLSAKRFPGEHTRGGDIGEGSNLVFPMGTIESLRPLLREVSGSDTSENADGYWDSIDKSASMTPREAANKLKRAGFGCLETAKIVIESDPLVKQGLAHGNFTHEEVDVKISEVAQLLLPFFRNRQSGNDTLRAQKHAASSLK